MKLNLCCGANVFPGWLNVDKTDVEQDYLRHLREAPDEFIWLEPQRELAAWIKAGKPLEFLRHDVRTGLPWPDNSADVIYIGQAIEHFNRRTEAPALLRECFRVLKSGGLIRLTTPHLRALVQAFMNREMDSFKAEQPEFYAAAPEDDQLAYLLYGATGPGCTAENYEGHFHCYTPRTLRLLLHECGFAPCHEPETQTKDYGMSHSFSIEGLKP